jgi:glucan phosphorylase
MEKETKQQRFKRVVEKRVQNILNGIKSLSQCTNQKIYAWDDEQLQKIWDAIDRELTLCKESFHNPEGRAFRL